MKCAALAVAGALCALAVRKQSGEFAALIGIAAVVALGAMTLELMKPVVEFARALKDRAGLQAGIVGPVAKTMAIGVLTQTGKHICEDAGEKTIGGVLEFSGGVAAFYVLLPLLQSVLDLMEALL